MNKTILFVVFIILTILSCKRDPIPRNAIERNIYIDILVDVHIAESIYISRVMLKMDTLKSNELYLAVLKKYGVSEQEMLITSLYYSRNQREYDKIYAEVLTKISLLIEDGGEPNKQLEKKAPEGKNIKEMEANPGQ